MHGGRKSLGAGSMVFVYEGIIAWPRLSWEDEVVVTVKTVKTQIGEVKTAWTLLQPAKGWL